MVFVLVLHANLVHFGGTHEGKLNEHSDEKREHQIVNTQISSCYILAENNILNSLCLQSYVGNVAGRSAMARAGPSKADTYAMCCFILYYAALEYKSGRPFSELPTSF